MKKKLALLVVLTFSLACKLSASGGQGITSTSNYVVIGAFSISKNAIEFTETAKKNKIEAQYSINPLRKLFYVYVMQTNDLASAFDEANKLRKETTYSDTWVFTGRLGEETQQGNDINPVTGKQIETLKPNDNIKTVSTEQTASINVATAVIIENQNQPLAQPVEELPEGSKSFLFKIFTGDKKINGDVDVMDLDKSRPYKVASYLGNENVNIKPINKSGNMGLECEVFGYRKIQQHVNFNDPQATDGITVDGNKITVPFELVRLKKGDIAIMYNVYFYKDAAIMRPESRYEVNSLLDMLKENPKYKIRIHGHTNGNASGKIISTTDPKNFFALNNTKDGRGSAKKLSEERALVIHNYLIAQGINRNRMEIKAWGGKKPIYGEDSPQAQLNVRVEIEILEDGSTQK
ncbi:MAG: OmpA family protein [Bacteroidetes bacterium]|nr:OmpA family protein [Bacteroidota bacterium]MBS1980595.1 OmpA family protein [Bacteroidota bacterium]